MSRPVRVRVWTLVGALVLLHFFLHVGLAFGEPGWAASTGLSFGAPDLLTVGLLLAARELGLGRAAAMGCCLGLLEDALSALAFGANSVALTLVGIGGAFTRDLFIGDSLLFLVSYFWIGKWVRDLLHWVSVGEGLRQPFVEQVIVQGA